MTGSKQLKKVAEYAPPRLTLCAIGVGLGVLAGLANSLLGIDTSFTSSLAGWLLASIAVIVLLHEGTHASVAALLGHKPLFGLKPPLVYVTLTKKVPRVHFMMVSIAPLVVLDVLFVILYAGGRLKIFCDLSLIINTIGSVGDMWVVLKLISAPTGSFIQDTRTGFEVWTSDDGQTALGEIEEGLRHGS